MPILLLLPIAGCTRAPPKPPVHTPHDSASWGVFDSYCPSDLVPPSIQSVEVTCMGSDRVSFWVNTDHQVLEGVLYEIETGATQPWSENVPLTSPAWSVCDEFGVVAGSLATGAMPSTAEEGVSTPFTCEAFEGGDLTWAVMVKALSGEAADCVVFGLDPDAVMNGTILGTHPPAFDTSTCRLIPWP